LAPAGGRGLEEVKQLRGYQPGDRLRDVHWPSSARFGQLYVKEYEGQPSRPLLRLRLDFTHEAGDDLTAYYELVYGLVLASLESGREVELADTDELVLKPAVISQREDLDQAMKRLYDAPAISESAGGDLVLATDLTLRRGGKIIREFRKGDGGEIQI
ncbi:DUF58 domain-containing protein, partial [Lactobacillus nasalidis]|uniref:DUF58 domain-containing protein n=1 Tax=Lactobacillus nasalidis TaxID=2797258 RepID=UPI001916C32C